MFSIIIIFFYRDGAGAAGIFCAVHNAVQELRRDGEIDMFTIVRQIHVRRPEVIGKLVYKMQCRYFISYILCNTL